ncbi:MAG: agmatinase [Alphaproteobacteria bacterium]
MRLPMASDVAGLDAAIIGLPSDAGSPFRTGARFGPNAIRAMSIMLRPVNPYQGNINVFERLKVADAGDAGVVPGYMPPTLERIEGAIASLLAKGVVPVALGGDHSVSIAELRALARTHGPVALVHFDSHTDTWDRYFGGERHSAGTPFRRAVEEGLVDPKRSIQIGMRGSLFTPADIQQSVELGYDVVDTDAIFRDGVRTLAERVRARVGRHPAFLTFDMDFVDPASAPGVQTPEAGGPSARETLTIVRALTGLNLVGCDVVECNPLFDGPGQVTSLLAATIASELLALIALERKAR